MDIKRALDLVEDLIEDRLQNPGRHDIEITEAIAMLRNVGEISLDLLDPTLIAELEAGTDTLTESVAEEYLRNGGTHCPFCMSDDLETIDRLVESDRVQCNNCKRVWTDGYTLTSITYEGQDFTAQLAYDGMITGIRVEQNDSDVEDGENDQDDSDV